MNKQGAVFDYVLWSTRIFAIIIVAIFIGVFVYFYLNEDFETKGIENFVLMKTLTYSPNCLALEEESVHPNVIDLKKMDNFKLAGCYQRPDVSFRMQLTSLDGKDVKKASIIPLNIEKLIPVCATVPEYTCTQEEEYVLYKDDAGALNPGVLKLEVIHRVA